MKGFYVMMVSCSKYLKKDFNETLYNYYTKNFAILYFSF